MNWRDTSMRLVFGLLALLFGWAAALQFNDPDPAIWVIAYGLAAVLCAAGAGAVRMPSWPGLLLGVAALVWAGWEAWIVWGPAEVTPMFQGDAGRAEGLLALEEAREMFGLLIAAAASFLYAWWMRRLDRRAR